MQRCGVVFAFWLAFAACSGGGSNDDLRASGDEVFRTICAKCHSEDGHGGLPMSPGGPSPRDFTDPVWQSSRTDEQLATVIRDGKLPMPSFQALLSPRQIEAVIARIRRFRPVEKK